MAHENLTSPRSASESLRLCWQLALRFRIGNGERCNLAQLPNADDFPSELPTADLSAGYALGEVLGIAALKLFRPWPVAPGEVVELDPMGSWLEDLARSDYTMDRARLIVLGRVLEMALRVPDRLSVLIARLDSLGNDDLHRMAMDAVQGRPVLPDVFAGLME